MATITNLGSLRVGMELPLKDWNKNYKTVTKDVAKFPKKTEKALAKAGKAWEKHAGSIKKAGIAMTAAGAAIVGTLTGLALHTAKAGDELDKMSLRTGESVENLSALSFAAEISGSNIQDLENGIRRLSRNMNDTARGIGEARRSFEQMGISVKNSDGDLRAASDLILEISDKMRDLGSESEKTAVAQELFGRGGAALLPLLKQGSAGIEELMTKAGDLGLVITAEAASGAAEFTDRLTEMKASLSATAFQIGNVILPVLKPMIERFTEIASSASKWIAEHPKLTEVLVKFGGVVGGIMAVGGPLLLMAPTLIKSAVAVKTMGAALAAVSWGPIGLGIAGVGLAITGLAIGLDKYAKSKSNAFKELKAIEGNASGITASIDEITVAIGSLQKEAESGTKEVSLLGVGIDSMGKDVLPIDDQIKRLNRRLEDLQHQLVVNKEGYKGWSQTARKFKEDNIDAAGSVNELSAELDKNAKTYDSYYDFLTASLNGWKDITGEGYRATIGDQVNYLNELLGTVEKESTAWTGLNNLKTDLRDQSISDQVSTATEALAAQKAFLDERFRREVAAAEREKAALLRIRKDEGEDRKEKQKTRDKEQKDALLIPKTTAKEIIKIRTNTSAVTKKIVDDGSLHMEAATDKQIADGARAGKAMVASQIRTVSEIEQIWKGSIADIKFATSDLFASMIDPSIETGWKQFWNSLKTTAIQALADIVVSEAWKAVTQIGVNLFSKDGMGAAFPATAKKLLQNTSEQVAASSAVTASSAAVVSSAASVIAPIAAGAFILRGASLVAGGGGQREIIPGGLVHPQVEKALRAGQSDATVDRFLLKLREQYAKAAAFIENQPQLRQARLRQQESIISPLPEPLTFTPRRPEGTDRFGRPIAATVPMAPGRGNVHSGDNIFNIVLPEGSDIKSLDSADWERIFRDNIQPAAESTGVQFVRSDNLLAS